jgi:hypothetical protein
MCIVIIASLLSAGIAYDASPTTKKTLSGTKWLAENQNPSLDTKSIQSSPKLQVFATNSYPIDPAVRSRLVYTRYPSSKLPRRLGYADDVSFQDTFTQDSYLVTKTRDMEWYKSEPRNRWPNLVYYTEEDVQRLSNEPQVAKIHSNGGFTVWKVEGSTSESYSVANIHPTVYISDKYF